MTTEVATAIEELRALTTRSHPPAADALARMSSLTVDAIARTGRGLDLTGADLAGWDLTGADLRQATFNRAQLHGTILRRANLSGATLICPGMERTDLRDADLRGAYVHALAAQVCKFDRADLTHLVDATGALFHGCSFISTNLQGARLAGATFYQCDLTDAELHDTRLQGATINECVLTNAAFGRADVDQLTVTKCLMHGASFSDAVGAQLVIQRPTGADHLRLTGASLPQLRLVQVIGTELGAERLSADGLDAISCMLPDSQWLGAQLRGARFTACGLEMADFTSAALVGASLSRCSFLDATFTDAHAENLTAVECSLAGAKMDFFSGRASVFRDCDLSRVDLSGAYLYRAMLTGDPPAAMSLRGARLSGVNLVQAYVAADCSEADLRGAKCAYARLNQSSFAAAVLDGASLYEASLVKTDFTRARLAGVRAPFFADRCPGLEAALAEAGATDGLDCLELIRAVTRLGSGGST